MVHEYYDEISLHTQSNKELFTIGKKWTFAIFSFLTINWKDKKMPLQISNAFILSFYYCIDIKMN